MKRLLVLLLIPSVLFAQRKQGSPLDSHSPNMEILTQFSERAEDRKVIDSSQRPTPTTNAKAIPDGEYAAVEGDRQVAELRGDRGMGSIDIWKIRLDGAGKDIVRLTLFNDYEGWKASNPGITTDGKLDGLSGGTHRRPGRRSPPNRSVPLLKSMLIRMKDIF